MTGNGRLIDLDEQALEIFAFRKIQGYRVIGRAGQATDNARLAPGIQRSPGDDLLEQLQPDATRTGVGHQQAARLEQAKTEQVDVLVGTCGAVGMGSRGGELGRIEDDQVESPPGLAKIAQRLEDIGLQPLGTLGRQLRIERQVGPGLGQRRAGRIDGQHMRRPTRQRLQREAAGVIRSVKHYKSL